MAPDYVRRHTLDTEILPSVEGSGSFMNRRYNESAMSMALAFLAIVLVLSAGGTGVSAQEDEKPAADFSLSPVDAEGGYFDLTLSPGDTQPIQVEVRNSGATGGEALIYLADVSTRVNGGVAAGLAGEPVSEPALWIDFAEEIVPLEAGTSLSKTFTINVPDDAAPGEHMTSFVIQDAGDGADTESESGVKLKTVSRQALPVLITVPGPVTPSLEIGTAGHTTVGDHSVVTFQAMNPGNVRIRSTGEFTIADSGGQALFQSPVQYESVYAGTSTTLEVPLDFLLEPGDYVVTLWLEDSTRGLRVESSPLSLNIPVPEVPNAANSQAPETVTGPASAPVIETRIVGIPTWVLLVAIPAATVLGVLIALGVVLGLRRRSTPAAEMQQLAVTREEPPAAHKQPAIVRQMTPPSRKVPHDG